MLVETGLQEGYPIANDNLPLFLGLLVLDLGVGFVALELLLDQSLGFAHCPITTSLPIGLVPIYHDIVALSVLEAPDLLL